MDLHDDSERLRAWTRGNLESYWRPWLAKSQWLPPRFGAWSLRPDFVEWVVPGVIRLHDTLATGEISSKAGAGAYALGTVPGRWRRINNEAVDIRTNRECTRSLYGRSIMRRRRNARACIAMVIEGALAR